MDNKASNTARGGLKKVVTSFFEGSFFSDKFNRYSAASSVLINIIMWISILIKIHAQDKPIPLHFNAFYGIEFVGSGFLFLNVPLVGLLTIIVNFLLGKKLWSQDAALGYITSSASVLIQILLFIAMIAVFRINA